MKAIELNDRIQKIREALELVEAAQELVDQAVRGTNVERHYLAYGRYGFNTLTGTGNPYDSSLKDLIKDLKVMMGDALDAEGLSDDKFETEED